MESKRALVTGISGQDGSYLAEYLLTMGYEVHGVVRRHAVPSFPNIQGIVDEVTLHEADLADQASLDAVVAAVRPDEVYSLGAQSHVGTSFAQPELTRNVTGLGAARLFEAVRRHAPSARVYQASSSEMYGRAMTTYGLRALGEDSPMEPTSPYGTAKLFAHKEAHYHREAFGMFVSCGILFNHESQRRGPLFLTRKVSLAVARMAEGSREKLTLGNLDAVRDWGHASEYVVAMHRMLQLDEPGDFVVGTGEGHSVGEFVDEAFRVAGVEREPSVGSPRVVSSEALLRPSDIPSLVADSGRAAEVLKWEPTIRFEELVRIMVEHDRRSLGGASS